jgi:hypothetical protein
MKLAVGGDGLLSGFHAPDETAPVWPDKARLSECSLSLQS